MQITLSQLKEIAKAGYATSCVYNKLIDECSIEWDDTISILLYPKDMIEILHIEMNKSSYVCLNADGDNFNHLAAIRKMEELGLIIN